MSEPADVLSLALPEAVRMALWIPVEQLGGTYFTCQLHGCGHVASATSRSKRKALGYALEELARLVLSGANDGPTSAPVPQPSGGASASG